MGGSCYKAVKFFSMYEFATLFVIHVCIKESGAIIQDMKVYRISAITLKVKEMEKSCSLYSKFPGFRLTYGGKPSDLFTTFEIGKESKATYLNLELMEEKKSFDFYKKSNLGKSKESEDFG